MVISQRPLNKGQWFTHNTKKRAIVIHGTAGSSVSSAVDWWNSSPVQVATSFIIDPHGVVFQTFPDEHWAYHTGCGEAYDKTALGIELVWPGTLTLKAGKYVTGYGTTESNPYIHPTPWRGNRFFAPYSTAQVQALAVLTDHLMTKHAIPRNFVSPERCLGFEKPYGMALNGVIPHSLISNVRSDVGPSFPWRDYVTQVQELQ